MKRKLGLLVVFVLLVSWLSFNITSAGAMASGWYGNSTVTSVYFGFGEMTFGMRMTLPAGYYTQMKMDSSMSLGGVELTGLVHRVSDGAELARTDQYNGSGACYPTMSFRVPLYLSSDAAISLDYHIKGLYDCRVAMNTSSGGGFSGVYRSGWSSSSLAMPTNLDSMSEMLRVEIYASAPLLTADLEPMSGDGAGWVFDDWRYYTFTATVPSGLYTGAIDTLYVSFDIPTGNGTVLCSPYEKGGNFSLYTNASSVSADRSLDPVRVIQGSVTDSGSQTVVALKVWFTSKCLDVYDSVNGVIARLIWNDTSGAVSPWFIYPNFFRIYNHGGFSLHTDMQNNAGVIPGGRDFSMFAYNDSYAYKDLVWRDLQHIKMSPTVNFLAGEQAFTLHYQLDYVLTNGSYVSGLQAKIDVSYVSYTGVFAGNVWINMTCSWYARGSLVKADNLYMFYHNPVYKAGDAGRWQFWVDLWFDSGNASSLLGGRINAYEYPMEDNSQVWLRWLSSNWGAKDDVLKQSECIVPITDVGNNTISSEQISFVRVSSALNVIPYNANQYVAIVDFTTFDTTLSNKYPLQGIQTPPWDETKMPTVGNSGVLGAIWSMFAGIGKWLSDNIVFGGLSLWPTFVNFLDTIAGWLGMPNGFTNMIAWLSNAWSWLSSSFGYALSLFYDVFLFLAQIMGTIISVFGQAVTSGVNFIQGFQTFMGGAYTSGVNLWNAFGITTWLTVFLVMYPIYLVILWDQEGWDALLAHLTFVWGLVNWLGEFFIRIIRMGLDLIGRIVESIPVVE